MNPLFQLALRSVTPKETALPYQLGGNSDPHFQGNGSKPAPEPEQEGRWDDEDAPRWSLRDEGCSDGQGESYGERNT